VSKKSVLGLVASILVAGTVAFAATSEVARVGAPAGGADAPAPIVFVCRNGVAMSVWSAAYFNELAAERGLPQRAVARAAVPSYTEVPLRMKLALALDGFRVGDFRPSVIDGDDARGAARVIAIDTELPLETGVDASRVELWNGFPPMREEYFPSRRALESRVEALVERLAADKGAQRP